MIWATVSSWSCFCWLYRASPSLAAKNIINLILVLTIWWCPCIESSQVPSFEFSSVQSLRCVWLFVTPCTAACQTSLSITNSRSPPKPMSIEWWCHPTISFFVVPFSWASLVAQRLKCLPGMRETQVQSLGREDPLEKEMATHSSTLAWRIPRREEPGRLQSMGSQRVGSLGEGNGNPFQYSCLENPMEGGAW